MGLELKASEVTDYLLVNAFCNKRTDASNKSSHASSASDTVKTTTLDKTLSLLSGSYDSLDKVQSNLKEMKEIAASITPSSSDEERETAYAKLRSLASGMDDIIGEITYDENVLFDGTELDLTSAGQYNHTVLSDLTTTSEKVGLASETTGADIKISYDEFCQWNNTMVDLKGLDISGAKGCKISASDTELKDGDYVVKVSYAGAKSTVSILDNAGTVISEEKADLSGSGVTTIDFDCGVQLTFDKTQVEGSIIDKHDYENDGPAVLYADLSYSRVNTYDLEGSQTAVDRGVKTVFTQSTVTDDKGGTFKIANVGLGALDEDGEELDSGTYKIEVYKTGSDVSAIMYNSRGMVVGGVSDVILNEDGTTSLDFGNGIAMTVNDKAFEGSATLVSTVEYTKTVNSYDDFDFEAYADKIDTAISAVTEQQDTLNSASAMADTVSKALDGTLSDSINSTTSQIITNLLGGSGSTTALSLLSGSSSGNTGLAWASSLITSNLSSALGLSSDSGTSLSSLLSGNVKKLNPTSLPTNVSVTV